ncbi:MAG: helix-turn-helix domain-containing protein, partial [Solirubrobacteraceae bacterium]
LALGLRRDDAVPAEPLLRADEHLPELVLLRDPELARALVARTLASFAGLSGVERARLLETLRAWLDHQRYTPAVAAQLHVHPQTVRYRMAKLRELLGESLDTPDGRFELALALRIRAAYSGTGGG